jgi:hypothetical protein
MRTYSDIEICDIIWSYIQDSHYSNIVCFEQLDYLIKQFNFCNKIIDIYGVNIMIKIMDHYGFDAHLCYFIEKGVKCNSIDISDIIYQYLDTHNIVEDILVFKLLIKHGAIFNKKDNKYVLHGQYMYRVKMSLPNYLIAKPYERRYSLYILNSILEEKQIASIELIENLSSYFTIKYFREYLNILHNICKTLTFSQFLCTIETIVKSLHIKINEGNMNIVIDDKYITIDELHFLTLLLSVMNKYSWRHYYTYNAYDKTICIMPKISIDINYSNRYYKEYTIITRYMLKLPKTLCLTNFELPHKKELETLFTIFVCLKMSTSTRRILKLNIINTLY